MLKNLIRLVRDAVDYLIASAIPILVGALLLPIVTRFLTDEEYGVVSITTTVTAVLTMILQLGLLNAYGRFYYNFMHDPNELRRHISTSAITLASWGLLASILLTFLGGWAQPLLPGVPFSPYVRIAIWSGYFGILAQMRLNAYRYERKTRSFLVFAAAHTLTTTLLTVLFVVFLRKGAVGYVGAILASNIVFAIISIALLWPQLTLLVDLPKLKASLRYGLPLIPHMLGGWMFNLADRLMINYMVDTQEVGLYAVGYQLGMVMNIVSTAINFAWSPFFFSLVKEKGEAAKTELAKFSTYWVVVTCLVFLLVSLFCREAVILLTDEQFHEAYHIVPVVAGGYLFIGLYFMTTAPLFWLGKTPYIAAVTITSGLLNIGLNWLLIPSMKMQGAALATLVCCAFQFIVIAALAHKWFPMPYEYGRLAKILAATAVCYLGAYVTSNYVDFWWHFVVKLGLVAAFPLLLVLLSFPTRDEWKALGKAIPAAVTLLRTAPGRFRRGDK